MNQNVKIEIWDTGGQERFRSMANLYYRSASAALVVYDITDASTFDAMQAWIAELDEKAPKGLTVVIIGNKTDLAGERQVTTNRGEQFAKQRQEKSGQPTLFVETSAKTGENVEKAFKQLANVPPTVKAPSGVQLTPKAVRRRNIEQGKQSKCCK